MATECGAEGPDRPAEAAAQPPSEGKGGLKKSRKLVTKPGSRLSDRLETCCDLVVSGASWIVSDRDIVSVNGASYRRLDASPQQQVVERRSIHRSQWLDFGASELVVSGFGVLVAHL